MRVKLSDAFDLQMGKTPSRGEPDYWNGENAWVSIADLSNAGKYISETKECITDIGVARSGIRVVPRNTVIMSFKLSIGKTAITAEDMYTNEAIMAFIDKGVYPINVHYLYHLFSNMDWSEGSNKAVMGITLNKATLSEKVIELPDMAEQQEVAAMLDHMDTLISLRKQQIAKLDELVKARFVEMFETGQWSTVKASNFMSNMRNGVSPSNSGTISAKVLTLSAITQGTFDKDAWKDGIFDIEPSEDKRISSCDFYMCRGNGNKNLVGSGVYSRENYYDLVFPDTVIAAQIDTSQVMLPFLFHAWKRPSVRSQIEAGARTTNGTYKINQKVIASVEIVHPPLDLQHQFAAFVAQTDQQKLTIQHSLAKLELLKKALMQKYFG